MLAWLTLSCKMNESEQIETLLSQWNGKEILFPDDLSFEILLRINEGYLLVKITIFVMKDVKKVVFQLFNEDEY